MTPTPRRRPRSMLFEPEKRFDAQAAMQWAEIRLTLPPDLEWIERPTPRGDVVMTFALPLEVCPTTNATRRKPDWWYVEHRRALWNRMFPQSLPWRRVRGIPLEGRPQVHCVRFCPNAPDSLSDWGKSAVDRLILPLTIVRKGKLVNCRRLGLILDDNPEAADVRQWWEPCSKESSCVYIVVRTGA